MRILYMVLLVLLAAVVIVFSLQNAQTVTVSFFTWSTTLPLFVSVIGAYLLGMASGGSVAGFLRHSVQRTQRKPGSSEFEARR